MKSDLLGEGIDFAFFEPWRLRVRRVLGKLKKRLPSSDAVESIVMVAIVFACAGYGYLMLYRMLVAQMSLMRFH